MKTTLLQDAPTVPGEFSCPDCGFVLTKSIINPTTGSCGRDDADLMEPCPNDGAIMRPVRYDDALNEARAIACKNMARSRVGEQMSILLENLISRGRLYGHELEAAKNILSDWNEIGT